MLNVVSANERVNEEAIKASENSIGMGKVIAFSTYRDNLITGGDAWVNSNTTKETTKEIIKNNAKDIMGNTKPGDTRKIYDRVKSRHDAEPWKDSEDIVRIAESFYEKHMKSWQTSQKYPNSKSRKWNPRYLRNYLLIVIGCNCGLRASDLIKLQLGHFLDKDYKYRDTVEVLEDKTANRHRDTRTIYINKAMVEGIDTYLKYHTNSSRDDYLFPNGYGEGGVPNTEYITRQNLDLILKGITKEMGLDNRVATHTLRKSFAYHTLKMVGDDDRGVKVLQKILGHTNVESTYHYTGITQDEVKDVCMGLNLGV